MIGVNLQDQVVQSTDRLNVHWSQRSEVQTKAQEISRREFFEVR